MLQIPHVITMSVNGKLEHFSTKSDKSKKLKKLKHLRVIC